MIKAALEGSLENLLELLTSGWEKQVLETSHENCHFTDHPFDSHENIHWKLTLLAWQKTDQTITISLTKLQRRHGNDYNSDAEFNNTVEGVDRAKFHLDESITSLGSLLSNWTNRLDSCFSGSSTVQTRRGVYRDNIQHTKHKTRPNWPRNNKVENFT